MPSETTLRVPLSVSIIRDCMGTSSVPLVSRNAWLDLMMSVKRIQIPSENNLVHRVVLQKLEEEVVDQENEDPLGASPDDLPKSFDMGLQSCSRLNSFR